MESINRLVQVSSQVRQAFRSGNNAEYEKLVNNDLKFAKEGFVSDLSAYSNTTLQAFKAVMNEYFKAIYTLKNERGKDLYFLETNIAHMNEVIREMGLLMENTIQLNKVASNLDALIKVVGLDDVLTIENSGVQVIVRQTADLSQSQLFSGISESSQQLPDVEEEVLESQKTDPKKTGRVHNFIKEYEAKTKAETPSGENKGIKKRQPSQEHPKLTRQPRYYGDLTKDMTFE